MSLRLEDCIVPAWPVAPAVRAIFTTRVGGVSTGSLASLNLGRSVGDHPDAVEENRRRVQQLIGVTPRWMSQVHGIDAAHIDGIESHEPICADAAVSRTPGNACAVMMADCLTVVFCDRNASVVAAAHAGWRGLTHGVLEASVAAMRVAPNDVFAYMGPAIGAQAFEVGADVRDQFLGGALPGEHRATAAAFVPCAEKLTPKWLANIYALAHIRLSRVGVLPANVFGGGLCTVTDQQQFFSHRRQTRAGEKSGRMAALIWLD